MTHRRPFRAFTLVEMIVVVGIIAALLAILLPAISTAKRTARLTGSQSNMRNITMGLTAYSVGNKDDIISCNTEREFNHQGQLLRCKAWVDAQTPHNVIVTNGEGVEQPGSLHDGAAWPYIASGGFEGGVYRSPLDYTGRIRSYSLNGAIGKVPDQGFMDLLVQLQIRTPPARSLGQVRDPEDTMYVLPEDMRGQIGGIPNGGWNLHGYIVDFFNSRWIDVPAYWAVDGICLSFLDGHNDYHLWEDTELRKKVTQNHTVYPGPDFDYIRSIMMPGLEHLIGAED